MQLHVGRRRAALRMHRSAPPKRLVDGVREECSVA
jgi:hypothetical protein